MSSSPLYNPHLQNLVLGLLNSENEDCQRKGWEILDKMLPNQPLNTSHSMTWETLEYKNKSNFGWDKISKPQRICQSCGVKDSAMKCSGCKNTYYCSTSCQRTHWSCHRKYCGK